jgi:membrane-associated phospholipid phosphatase
VIAPGVHVCGTSGSARSIGKAASIEFRRAFVEPDVQIRNASWLLLAIAVATFNAGCATVRGTALATLQDPAVWVPMTGAAVLQIDDWDRRVSTWARRTTPLFGSTQAAEQWSDRLRAFPAIVEAGSIVMRPGGDDVGSWLTSKVELGAVDLAAIGSTMLTVKGLKGEADRLRPNGADRESFPSGHAASAAANATLASLNLAYIPWDPEATRVADLALGASVYGTAWARVEAGEHYPSDTLAAIAMGNFISSVFHVSLIDGDSRWRIALVPQRHGARLKVSVAFRDP